MRKVIGTIIAIVKVICIIVLLMLIFVLALQRFSNNKLAIGGFRVFNIVTGSMVPDYVVGDVVVIKEVDPETLKLGDDITYLGKEDSFAGRVVTHRLIRIEETTIGKRYYTQGIANPSPDPVITADQIYGKVIYKCILVSALAKLMNNMALFYVVVFIPLAILIVMEIIDFAKRRKEDSEDDDEEDEYEEDDDEEYEDDEDDEEDDD